MGPSKIRPPARAGDTQRPVIVHFKNMAPDELLVHFVRELCRRRNEFVECATCWSIWVNRGSRLDRENHEVSVELRTPAFSVQSSSADPDPFLAVRNAFALLTRQMEQTHAALLH